MLTEFRFKHHRSTFTERYRAVGIIFLSGSNLNNYLILIAVIFALILPSSAQTATETENKRTLFLAAEKALKADDIPKYNTLAPLLTSYPLYPYLLYDKLTSLVKNLPIADMQYFFANYGDVPISQKLYILWLTTLANQQQWNTFIQFYNPARTNSNKLQCLYAKAKLMVGDLNTANTVIQKLWLSSQSQPKECDYAFNEWKKNGHLTDDLIWQRFNLAINDNSTTLALTLLKMLPPSKQNAAKIILTVHKSPSIITNNTFLQHAKNKTISLDIITHGFVRLAQKHPLVAKSAWENQYRTLGFSPEQKKQIIKAISNGLINTSSDEAFTWIDKLAPQDVDEKTLTWELRKLLSERKWIKIQQKFEQNTLVKKEPIWQYWYARSLEEQNQKEKSTLLFQQLAKERNYYGFLAASRLNKSFSIYSTGMRVNQDEYKNILNNRAIQRAYELYQLKRYRESEAEWSNAIDKLDSKQRYVAAKIANFYGWSKLALTTSAKSAYKNDLLLLYPTPFRSFVNIESQRNRLSPALVYAMIRQESYFQQTAISHVGARGLMQLMPTTAIYVAQQLNHPLVYIERLFDPATNIFLGTAYLQYLFKTFKDHPILAIASYNAGPTRVKRWLPKSQPWSMDLWVETIPITETREYVKFVITFAMIYEYQLGKKPNIMPYLQAIPPLGTLVSNQP